MRRRTEKTSTSREEEKKIEKEFIKAFANKKQVKEELKVTNFSKILGALGRTIERLNTELEMQEKLIRIGEAEVKDSETKLKEAERKLRSCQNALQELCIEDEQIKKEKQTVCEKLDYFKKLEIQFSRIVLLHISATTKQIVANLNGTIVTTKKDAAMLKNKGIVIDETFRLSNAEHLITIVPEGIKDKYDPLKWKSIIEFCEMVANFKMRAEPEEEEKIVILYSNWDIAEILKANGLEVH